MSGGALDRVRVWSLEEVERDATEARHDFRQRRMGEPLARYLDAFDVAQPAVQVWVAQLEKLLAEDPQAEAAVAKLWSGETGRTVFRYLGAPPISADDLETLSEARIAAFAVDPAARGRLLSVIKAVLDPRRFPWIAEGRAARASEAKGAVLATTSLIASQRVQTLRRGDEQSAVEGAVRGLLIGLGWQQSKPRSSSGVQKLVTDAPAERQFFVQTNLGSDNADLIVRLDDGRLLAVECKGSNSEINSRKRLNKEAVQNARAWLQGFGAEQVVPAVALQGVFKARYVAEAQATPMAVFWGHRLDDLKEFMLSGR